MGVELEEIDMVDNPGRSGIMGFGGEPAEITVTLLQSKKTTKTQKKSVAKNKKEKKSDVKPKESKNFTPKDDESTKSESSENIQKLNNCLQNF